MRNRCSYAGLVSAYFSVYLAGTKNVSTNTIYSYRDTFVIFHGYLEKYCVRTILIYQNAAMTSCLQIRKGKS